MSAISMELVKKPNSAHVEVYGQLEHMGLGQRP